MWTYLWFGIMVVCLIIESETIAMVSLWFGIGALCALVLSLFSLPWLVQLAVFFLASAVLLISLRPIVKKHLTPKIVPTNIDAIIGKTAKVVVPIDNLAGAGQIKLSGIEWTARSTDGAPIPAGTIVAVDRIEGVKAFVSPVINKN